MSIFKLRTGSDFEPEVDEIVYAHFCEAFGCGCLGFGLVSLAVYLCWRSESENDSLRCAKQEGEQQLGPKRLAHPLD